jgi:hypothetical protein
MVDIRHIINRALDIIYNKTIRGHFKAVGSKMHYFDNLTKLGPML